MCIRPNLSEICSLHSGLVCKKPINWFENFLFLMMSILKKPVIQLLYSFMHSIPSFLLSLFPLMGSSSIQLVPFAGPTTTKKEKTLSHYFLQISHMALWFQPHILNARNSVLPLHIIMFQLEHLQLPICNIILPTLCISLKV